MPSEEHGPCEYEVDPAEWPSRSATLLPRFGAGRISDDMASNKRRRDKPDQIIRKLAEGDRLLGSSKELDAVYRHPEVAESTWQRELARYGGMRANDAKRLKELDAENARLKELVANQALDIDMLREVAKREF